MLSTHSLLCTLSHYFINIDTHSRTHTPEASHFSARTQLHSHSLALSLTHTHTASTLEFISPPLSSICMSDKVKPDWAAAVPGSPSSENAQPLLQEAAGC